jgi:hypothetical protein
MKTAKDPTKIYQKQVKQVINTSIIPEKEKWKLNCMNPTLPKIKGLVKLHKEHTPIRPIINLCNFPAYNLGKFVTNTLTVFLNFQTLLMLRIIEN